MRLRSRFSDGEVEDSSCVRGSQGDADDENNRLEHSN